MTKKYTFDCTLFVQGDMRLNITCDELLFQQEITFTDYDEWNSFSIGDKNFDVHLLYEPDEDKSNLDAWEISIYRCVAGLNPDVPDALIADTSTNGQQLVNLVIHDSYVDDDDEEEADCIAREYEWHCTKCGYLNIVYEYSPYAHCTACRKKNRIAEPNHAIA